MKILTLDDHPQFIEGLEIILNVYFSDLHIVKFKSLAELKNQKVCLESCDLFISEIEMPNENIIKFLSSIRMKHSKLPIFIISRQNKLSLIKKCKKLKIKGYILKDDPELIIKIVKYLISGQEYYSEKVKQILNMNKKLLSPKEEKIIALIAKGNNNHEIAKELFIRYYKVVTHRKNINRKLDLNTNTEVIKYYFENYIQKRLKYHTVRGL